MRLALSYDDVLLTPQYSDIASRNEIDIGVQIDDQYLDIPIISSPMDTVTWREMACSMRGGLGILHRYCTIEEQTAAFKHCVHQANDAARGTGYHPGAKVPFCAVGVTGDFKERVAALEDAGCWGFCVDVAHGHHSNVADAIKYIKERNSSNFVIAGNVATPAGYWFLAEAGADAVRVGIGGGCFIPGTMVKTEGGIFKPIEECKVGERVYTHTGELHVITDTMTFQRDEEICAVNDIKCTKNHEFYVVHKQYVDIVTEDNIHEYAVWLEADQLTKDYFLIEMKNIEAFINEV